MKEDVIDVFRINDVRRRIQDEINTLNEPLNRNRSAWVTDKRNCFVVLRRWSSYTPFMVPDPNSLGGGYALVWQKKVVVIDPGCHFFSNFKERRFRLADIHAVVVTHSHLDHTHELESLMSLLFEMNDNSTHGRPNRPKKVHFYFSTGVVKKHAGWLDLLHIKKKNSPISHINILDPRKDPNHAIWIPGTNIRLKPTLAVHDELIATNYSTGLLFELFRQRRPHRPEVTIGITSDTRWKQPIQDQFAHCDLLVLHLGGIKPCEFNHTNNSYPNHLGIRGCCDFLEGMNYRRALLSEWGEELKELRQEIMAAIQHHLPRVPPGRIVNCGDIGTTVSLPDLCLCCEEVGCQLDAIDEDIYRPNNSVKHFCDYHRP
jgi:ribonuclease BN (tRNA processing enzyme)